MEAEKLKSPGKVLQETSHINSGFKFSDPMVDTVTLVDQYKLTSMFRNKGISLSSLTDKLNAIEAGKLLEADYILTGTVMETTNTVIIFSRLLNVWNGEVESTAQVIVSR